MCFSESNDELLVPGANRLNRHFVPNSGQKRAGTEVMLAEVFPAAFYFVYNMIGVVLALLMIGFQIALICVQGPLYFTGSGIWVGVIFMTSLIINLTLVKNRTYKHYLASYYSTTIAFVFLIFLALMHAKGNIVCNERPELCQHHEYEWINTVIMVVAVLSKVFSGIGLGLLTSRIDRIAVILVAEGIIFDEKIQLEANTQYNEFV